MMTLALVAEFWCSLRIDSRFRNLVLFRVVFVKAKYP